MKYFLFFAFLFLAPAAFAGLPDTALTTSLKGTTFTGELSSGYHFNDKAPNLLIVDEARVAPAKLEKRKITFRLSKGSFTAAHAALYICDDALTFCVPKNIDLTGAVTQAPVARKSSPAAGKVRRNKHGFISDDLDAASKEAAKTGKLVFADFSARWCPGCVRLETELFGTAEFRAMSKGFVKVRLDFDRFETGPLKEKFAIHGIPSLLVLSPGQEEISRIVDYQPAHTISAFLKEAQANPVPIGELMKKATAGGKPESLLVGRRLYAAERFADAVPFLENAPETPIELLDARVQAARTAGEKTDVVKTAAFFNVVNKAIAEEPQSTRSLIWRTQLLERLDPKDLATRTKIVSEGTAVADDLLAHPEKLAVAFRGDAIGEFTGFEKLYLASERADLIEAAGLGDDADMAALKVVTQTGRELKIPASKTGTSLRFLIFLVAAHEYDDAEKVARAMLKLDPANPELERRMIKILNGQKKFGDAVAFARKALPGSFGKNEVWVAQQLAKAYVGKGDKLEAKALIEGYLSRPDIDWNSMPSEKKDLGEMMKTLE